MCRFLYDSRIRNWRNRCFVGVVCAERAKGAGMKRYTFILFLMLAALSGCVDRWSETSVDGRRFSDVEPLCRAQAERSAWRQLPTDFDYLPGPAGFPPDTREDIAYRETAMCLQNKGFTFTREWQ